MRGGEDRRVKAGEAHVGWGGVAKSKLVSATSSHLAAVRVHLQLLLGGRRKPRSPGAPPQMEEEHRAELAGRDFDRPDDQVPLGWLVKCMIGNRLDLV